MTTDSGAEYLASLVRELCKLDETEWLEFKQNNAYSGPIRPLILIEIGHPFWFKPATDSG